MCTFEKVVQVSCFLSLVIFLAIFVLLKVEMDSYINEVVCLLGGWFYFAFLLMLSFVVYFILDYVCGFIGECFFEGEPLSGKHKKNKLIKLRKWITFLVAVVISIDVFSLLASEIEFNTLTNSYQFVRLMSNDLNSDGSEPLISSLGTFGDFIGGTLNPLLTFLSFVGILYTVFLQRNGLESSERSMKETLEISRSQNSLSIIFFSIELNSKRVDALNISPMLIKPDDFRAMLFSNLLRYNGRLDELSRRSSLVGEDAFEFLIGVVKTFQQMNLDSAMGICRGSIGSLIPANTDKYERAVDAAGRRLDEVHRFTNKPYTTGAINMVVMFGLKSVGFDVSDDVVIKAVDRFYSHSVGQRFTLVGDSYKALVGSNATVFISYFRSVNSTLSEILRSGSNSHALASVFASSMRSEEIALIILESCVGRSGFREDLARNAKALKLFSGVKLKYDLGRDLFYIDEVIPMQYGFLSKLFDIKDGEIVGLGAFGEQSGLSLAKVKATQRRWQSHRLSFVV